MSSRNTEKGIASEALMSGNSTESRWSFDRLRRDRLKSDSHCSRYASRPCVAEFCMMSHFSVHFNLNSSVHPFIRSRSPPGFHSSGIEQGWILKAF